MKNKDNNCGKLFSTISNNERRQILSILNIVEKTTRSDLIKKMKISEQLLNAYLGPLEDYNLITRKKFNGKIMYAISNFGKSVIKQIDNIQFLEDHKDFLETHSLEYFPEQFVKRIGDLQNHDKTFGVCMNIAEAMAEIQRAKKYIKNIFDAPEVNVYKYALEYVEKNNVKIKYITNKDIEVPKEWLKIDKKMSPKLIKLNLLERKMKKESVHMIVQATESEAYVIFPNLHGIIDANYMFHSKDLKFRQWCEDLFEWNWERSQRFDEKRLKIKEG